MSPSFPPLLHPALQRTISPRPSSKSIMYLVHVLEDHVQDVSSGVLDVVQGHHARMAAQLPQQRNFSAGDEKNAIEGNSINRETDATGRREREITSPGRSAREMQRARQGVIFGGNRSRGKKAPSRKPPVRMSVHSFVHSVCSFRSVHRPLNRLSPPSVGLFYIRFIVPVVLRIVSRPLPSHVPSCLSHRCITTVSLLCLLPSVLSPPQHTDRCSGFAEQSIHP